MLSLLGEGGMGTVYLCEHAVLGRRFAVKVLGPDLARDPALAGRFRNEAVAASRIGGESAVDVVDFGEEEDGALYYVMEALDGRSLDAVIREEQPLPIDRVLEILEQVCRALAAAHARGVVHRDVKPGNVFLVRREDGSERAKVIDFGVSRFAPGDGPAGSTDGAGTIVGTPAYMAPEQGAGAPADPRADVYAVGVLAFEMLTGTLPIVGEGAIGTLLAHRTRAPDPPSRRRPDVPPEVDALVLRALAKRPADRHPSMEALAGAIAAVRARRGEGGRPGEDPRRRPAIGTAGAIGRGRSSRRRRALAATALAVVGSSIGAWLWRGAGPEAIRPTSAAPGAAIVPRATALPGDGARGPPGRAAAAASGGGGGGGGQARPRALAATSGPRPAGPAEGSAAAADHGGGAGAPPDAHLDDPYASEDLKEDPFR